MDEEQPNLSEQDAIEIEQIVKNMQRYKDEYILEKTMVISTETMRQLDGVILSLIRNIKVEKRTTNRLIHNNTVLLKSFIIFTPLVGILMGILMGIILHFRSTPLNCHPKAATLPISIPESLS